MESNNITILISLLGLGGMVLILTPVMSWLFARMPYIFPSTVVKGEEGKILSAEKIQELIELENLAAAISSLGGTQYAGYLKDEENIPQQMQLYKNHVQEDILRIVPEKTALFFRNVINIRRDIENLEKIFALRSSTSELSLISHDFISLGFLDSETLNVLKEIDPTERISVELENTQYKNAIAEATKVWKETELTSTLIDSLYQYYFHTIKEQLAKLKAPEKETAEQLIGCMIDVYHLKSLLRLKWTNASMEDMEQLRFSGNEIYSEIPLSALEGQANDILKFLAANSTYGEYFNQILRNEQDEDTTEIEQRLDLILLEKAREIASSRMFSLGNLLAYLFLKEHEMRQIETVLTGLKTGLTKNEIKPLLVLAAT